MLNFIFGLTPLNSALFIGWCLLFLLAIPLAVKAKSKYFTLLMCLFMLFAASQALYKVFAKEINMFFLNIPAGIYVWFVVSVIFMLLDTVIALLLLSAKPKLKKAVFIAFTVSNLLITLALYLSWLNWLLTDISLQIIFENISKYAVFPKVGVTLIFFILLLVFRYSKQNERENQTAATVTADIQTEKPTTIINTAINTVSPVKSQNSTVTESAQPSAEVKNTGLPKMYCKSCGYSDETENTICPHCFNEMTALRECSNCHNMTSGNYCGRCGAKIK